MKLRFTNAPLLGALILLILCSSTSRAQFGDQNVFSPLTRWAFDVYAADLDGDGFSDLISASMGDHKVAWYKNLGDNTFSYQIVISNEMAGARSVWAADLDSDGDQDIVCAGFDNNTVAWFQNDGAGNFSSAQIINQNAVAALDVAVADLNDDGHLDIISASSGDNTIGWYENNGVGFFGNEQAVTNEASGLGAIFPTDIDNDGDQDILGGYGPESDRKVVWLENNGQGEFINEHIIVEGLIGVYDVFAKDITGDNVPDVMYAGDNDVLAWSANDGIGGFGPPQSLSDTVDGPWSITAEDLDGDGDNDIIALVTLDNEILWFENDGSGGFGEAILIDSNVLAARDAFVADLNNDGSMDIAAASQTDNAISWFPNNGSAEFDNKLRVTPAVTAPEVIHTSDLDGDGDLDVLTTSTFFIDEVVWFENQGDLTFSNLKSISSAVEKAYGIYSADLDGDGDMDVLSASESDDKIAWYENLGNGEFGAQQIISTNADGAIDVYAADLDGDLDMDVLSASRFDNKIAWYENDGNGIFGGQQIITEEADGVACITTHDLDNDGDLDILFAASFIEDVIAWIENLDGSSFGPIQVISSLADGASSVAAADLDNDGDLDVLSTSETDDKLAWYANDGSGSFGDEIIISNSSDRPTWVAAEDLDGDGDNDVVATWFGDDKVVWYANNGSGTFGAEQLITDQVDGPEAAGIADIDNDGDLEVLSVSNYDYKVACYENVLGGCTDPAACNYDSTVIIDTGSCCYIDCGCTDSNASNYDEAATCENGTCLYSFSGLVYNDENGNSIFDDSEFGINLVEITLEPGGFSAFTNNDGQFIFNNLIPGDYSLEVAETEQFPFATDINPTGVTIEYGEMPLNVEFGLSADEPIFEITTTAFTFWQTYPCDTLVEHAICVHNESNVPLQGVVELQHDTLFQGYAELSPIDSVVDNSVFMSFEDLLPGDVLCLDILLHTPPAEFFGEFLNNVAIVNGFLNGVDVAFTTDTLSQELTCSYDPNDKQVEPPGQGDPHYVLDGTDLEYLIRFQNTGNAPAIDVVVKDTIDFNLDMASFEVIASSHSMYTQVNSETRAVEFVFENIMLPDSTNNEAESHGFVRFGIDPPSDLDHDTEINNTAYIFFDNNLPIITNTTWTTIYNCDHFMPSFTVDGNELTASEGSSYQWHLDGLAIEGATAQTLEITEDGNYSVQITNEWDCTATSDETFVLYTGIHQHTSISAHQLTIFPNPAQEDFTIQFPQDDTWQVNVFDSQGKLVHQ